MYKSTSRFMMWSAVLGKDSREQIEARDARIDQLAELRAAAGKDRSYAGRVTRKERYGVFVQGQWGQGMVHVSQMPHKSTKDLQDVIKIGNPVRVWILAVDKQNRVSLSMLAPSRRRR